MMSIRFDRFLICLVALGLLGISGCKMYGFRSGNDDSQFEATAQSSPDPIRIVYRTKTDRLNVAGAKLPPCSMATLQIQVPHPHGKLDAGLARLTTSPCTVDPKLSPKNLAVIVGQAPSVWEEDIPMWQITTIVSELESANFFHRAKVLNAASFLSVDAGRNRHGRPYREVPELDGMISRISIASNDRGASSSSRELARLPVVDAR